METRDAAGDAALAPAPPVTARRGTVLVVDDEPTFRETTEALLQRAGYETCTAADGEQALACVAARPVACVVADLRMPGNDDLELVRALAQRVPPIPVVLVTAYPSVRTAVAAVGTPVTAYLIKPFGVDELLDAVRSALGRADALHVLGGARERAERWQEEVRAAAALAASDPKALRTAVAGFVQGTVAQMAHGLTDIGHLTEALVADSPRAATTPCALLQCPRHQALRSALTDAVDVLEATKTAFKSRQLADLRGRLERVLAADVPDG
jgi:CheY-like chemotaxis protein